MSSHHTRLLAPVCVLATLLCVACDDDDNGRNGDRGNPVRPTPISFSGFLEPSSNSAGVSSRGVMLSRDTVTPLLTAGTSCPARPPFLAAFDLVGIGDRDNDLFLRAIEMRFVDRAGVVGGATTMFVPQLVERFGSTRIPRSGRRVFPFAFPFGCAGQPVGTLSIVAITGDWSDREERTSLSLAVR